MHRKLTLILALALLAAPAVFAADAPLITPMEEPVDILAELGLTSPEVSQADVQQAVSTGTWQFDSFEYCEGSCFSRPIFPRCSSNWPSGQTCSPVGSYCYVVTEYTVTSYSCS